jgi:hypothetical protein
MAAGLERGTQLDAMAERVRAGGAEPDPVAGRGFPMEAQPDAIECGMPPSSIAAILTLR